MDIGITFNLLPAFGIAMVLLAWYVPRFNDWYAQLSSEYKQLFNVVVLGVITIGATVLSYFGFLHIYQGSTWQEWAWYPLVDFVAALIANAGTYKATDKMLKPKRYRGLG